MIIILATLANCNVVQKEKKDDNNLETILLLSVVGSGGSCSIGVIKSGRETTASANPVVLSTTEQSISYSKVPVVSHSIGIVTFSNAIVGDVVRFNTVDVADFDGTSGPTLPLVYNTANCPVSSSSQITTNASTYYTRAESGTTYTYTINQAGNYSFVLYQLQYPATASTVKKN